MDADATFDLLAYCRRCGNVFPANNLSVGGGGRITLTGDLEAGRCPKCGGSSYLPAGDYISIPGGVTMNFWSVHPRVLEKIRVYASRIAGGESTEQVLEEAKEESPEFFALWKDLFRDPKTAIQLATFILALLTYLGCKPDAGTASHDGPVAVQKATFDAFKRGIEGERKVRKKKFGRKVPRQKKRNR